MLYTRLEHRKIKMFGQNAILKSSGGNFTRSSPPTDIFSAVGITREEVTQEFDKNIPVFKPIIFPFVKQALVSSSGFRSYLDDNAITSTSTKTINDEESLNQYAHIPAVQRACISYVVEKNYCNDPEYDVLEVQLGAQLQIFKLLADIRNITLRIWVLGQDNDVVLHPINQENDTLEASSQIKDGQIDLLLVDNNNFERLEPVGRKRNPHQSMASLSVQEETSNKKSHTESDHLNSQGDNSLRQSHEMEVEISLQQINNANFCSLALAAGQALVDYARSHAGEGASEKPLDISAINTLFTVIDSLASERNALLAAVKEQQELEKQQEELKNELENNGNTELHLAAIKGDFDKLKNLVTEYSKDLSSMTAALNQPNKNQETPVMLAVMYGHKECVDIFLAAGSSVSDEFRGSRSPLQKLYHSCKFGLFLVVKQLFEEHHFDAEFLNQKIEETNHVMEKDKLTEVITSETALYVACHYGHTEIVKLLLEHGADAKSTARNSWSCLFVAAKKGFTEIVRMLIDHGANVLAKNRNDMTALNIAAYGGFIEIAQILLDKDARNIDEGDNMGARPLHAAVQKGNLEMLKLLVEYGADINKKTNSDISILYVAAYSGHSAIVEYLTDNKDQHGNLLHPLVGRDNPQQLLEETLKPIDINTLNKEGLSALTVAAFDGHLSIVERLLKLDADKYKTDKQCVNALYAAVQNGHTDVVRCLLEWGYELRNIGNKNTPFHAAAIGNRTEILELLFEAFPDEKNFDTTNIDGVTPLYMACEKGHVGVVDQLIKKGANVNTSNRHTVSPLNIASQNGHTAVVKLLLENGADVNSQTEDGPSPLFIASQNGHKDICKLLLEHRADVDIRTKEKETALFVAGYFGYAEIVKLLIQYKASVNIVDRDTRTPVWWACKAGNEDVVKLLMDAGADINISDREHVTPMMIAAQQRKTEVCEVLNKAKEPAALCVVCLTNTRCTLFMPCKHLAACGDCDEKLEKLHGQNLKCPACKDPVTEKIRVFI